jgi:solute carrier family 45 protein 1/2/4
MTTDHSEGTPSSAPETTTPDSAYTSLSSLLKPASPNNSKQGQQQKLLSPTPIRKGNINKLYTVSERSEAGSNRSSPNFTVGQRNQSEGQLSPRDDRGRSRSRSPGAGQQVAKKKGNGKKSVWSLIALTISMGGAQVSDDAFGVCRRLISGA